MAAKKQQRSKVNAKKSTKKPVSVTTTKTTLKMKKTKSSDSSLKDWRKSLPSLPTLVAVNDDIVLSKLSLPNPCPIVVVLSKTSLSVRIGPRDIEWNLETGDVVSTGTVISDVAPLEPNEVLPQSDDNLYPESGHQVVEDEVVKS